MKKVGIIGGGIIGMSSAFYLRRAGHEVTIIDKGDMLGGCSWGNAGMIVPSHFVPLAAPGMISKGIRWMFNPLSPFYVRPRFDSHLVKWGLNFYKSATHKKVEHAAPALRDLSLFSKQCYQEFNKAIPFGLHSKGLLMLYRKRETGEEEMETVEMAHRLGIEALVLSADAVQAMEPNVWITTLGGIYFPGDMHLSPSELMSALRRQLSESGVHLLSNVTVTGFETRSRNITGVHTSDGLMNFDELILAAGSWSMEMSRHLGAGIPVEAGKGYSFMVRSSKSKVGIPTLLLDDRVAVTPIGNDIRFGGTMEIGGIDHSINMNRVRGIVEAIPRYYPEMKVSMPDIGEVWHGLRPCSPDGLPFIGRSRRFENLVIATGHGMMGVSPGPATGRLVADLLDGAKPAIAIDAFDVHRFG
jgi:D-amino-acid dehydrogenase